MPPRIAELLWA